MGSISRIPASDRLTEAYAEGHEVATSLLTRRSNYDGRYWLQSDLRLAISRCPDTDDVLVQVVEPLAAAPNSTELAIVAGMLWAAAQIQEGVERDHDLPPIPPLPEAA